MKIDKSKLPKGWKIKTGRARRLKKPSVEQRPYLLESVKDGIGGDQHRVNIGVNDVLKEATRYTSAVATRVTDLEKRHEELHKRWNETWLRLMKLEHQLPTEKVDDFGSPEWRASNPGKIIDYWPTKRDLWALRARVPDLSSNELVKALTQVIDRWQEMHG